MTAAADAEYAAIAVEPSLLPPSRRLRRHFNAPAVERDYLLFLEERILRDPRDLHAHVERVLLRDRRSDRAGTLAALVDLFIVLRGSGRALREGLLRRVEPHLDAGQCALLEAHLDRILEATAPAAAVPGARLSRPLAGTTSIVRCRQPDGGRAGAVPGGKAATQATDAERLLLEESLESDPGQEGVCRRLLDLYQQQGRRSDFERLRGALLGRRPARPDLWELAAAHFERPQASEAGRDS